MKLPRNAPLTLSTAALGFLAFTAPERMPANVLAGLSLDSAGWLVAQYDDASEAIDCERDPATGAWVWASLAPTVIG